MSAAVSSGSKRSLLLPRIGVVLFNAVYLAFVNRLPEPQRVEAAAGFWLANLLFHLASGVLMTLFYMRIARAWVAAAERAGGFGRVMSLVSLAGFTVCLVTGILLLVKGSLSPMAPVRAAHGIATVVSVSAGLLWALSVYRSRTEDAAVVRRARAATGLLAAGLVPGGALMWFASQQVAVQGRIVNPTIVPASMEGEGDGPQGKFWPSSVQTVDNKFFPPEYFTDNRSCGEAGCHPDIYKQWNSSAHRNGSFNNQWYRKSIEYMQEVVGVQPSKWCGGCHDMAVMLTEKPGTGKSRFEFPIKDQIYPPEKFIESHTGISCSACHSTVHVKSTMGNGDYVAEFPPMHKYAVTNNPLVKSLINFVTRVSPSQHRKTFLKPFHRDDTAKFCSSCHKVHLDGPVNNFRWLRGFNDYDPWQGSGVSGQGARSFYYPMDKDGKPAFKKCANCHMPEVASSDAGNVNGKVHHHGFPAANTALPFVNHDKEQLLLTQKFLQDGALSIDIFALRREQGSASGSKSAPRRRSAPSDKPEGESASLMGEVAAGAGMRGVTAADLGPVREDMVAPINRGVTAVRRGEDVAVDVVVRTRKVGHAFPGGTFDAFDVWVELQAKDETGRVLYWSGSLEWPGGPVEPSAHQYRALLVDGHSNEINKRNAWAARARVYARAIPPGAADTVHYRLRIPKDAGKKITLTAKLNYRKFSWYNTQFAFGGRPDNGDPNYSRRGFIEGTGVGRDAKSGAVTAHWDDRPMLFDGDLSVVAAKDRSKIPDLPITVLCTDTAVLDVVDGDPLKATAPRALDVKKDRERWNDYAIGQMLQGDFGRATSGFKRVTEIDPGWPEGYVNIGRVRLQEGDLAEAKAMLEKALEMYAAKPTPMTPYQKARTQFFYGMALKNLGRYDDAMRVWEECRSVFPNDRELRNQMGRVHFLAGRFDAAVSEFNHVLSIDPEDLTAHYNLMLCYRGKGGAFAELQKKHQALYYRFKNDETTTHLAGPYKRRNPHDNRESQMIHEHDTAPKPRTPEEVHAALAGRSVPTKQAGKPVQRAAVPGTKSTALRPVRSSGS
jgi:Flp pilus assembly protein TadD